MSRFGGERIDGGWRARWSRRTGHFVGKNDLCHTAANLDGDDSLRSCAAHSTAVGPHLNRRDIIASGNDFLDGQLGIQRILPGQDTIPIPVCRSGWHVKVIVPYFKGKQLPQRNATSRNLADLELSKI